MNPKIVFMGSPEFAVHTLQGLGAVYNVAAVVTQRDKAKGRGRVLSPTPVKIEALRQGVPVAHFDAMSSQGAAEFLSGLRPDLIIVVAFGYILPPAILKMPVIGCVNLHASLLPLHRGPSPIPAAILAGDSKTGVTTILMDEGIDTGDILLSRSIEIGDRDTAGTLHDKLAEEGALLMLDTVDGILSKSVAPIPQDHSQATYSRRLSKVDGKIDWRREAKHLDRLVRAMNPWPCAYCEFEGQPLKVLDVISAPGSGIPGRIENIDGEVLEIGTGSGRLNLNIVQPPGKPSMSAGAFARGRRLNLGYVFA